MLEPGPEIGVGTPSQCVQAPNVEPLARRPVGLRRVADEIPVKADDARDYSGEIGDGDVVSGPDVDVRLVRVETYEMNEGIGKIINVKEFATGFALPQISTVSLPASFA